MEQKAVIDLPAWRKAELVEHMARIQASSDATKQREQKEADVFGAAQEWAVTQYANEKPSSMRDVVQAALRSGKFQYMPENEANAFFSGIESVLGWIPYDPPAYRVTAPRSVEPPKLSWRGNIIGIAVFLIFVFLIVHH